MTGARSTGRTGGRLDLVIGCNGAGKSTFVQYVLGPKLPRSVFVNADVIAAQRWPDDPEGHSYDAAKIAARTREALIDADSSLIAETVFSHESKLALIDRARARDFYVAVHAVIVPVELAVARVAARVAAGGHSVPEEKIRQRYERVWPLAAIALKAADIGYVWDNSQASGPHLAAQLIDGYQVGVPTWPTWAPAPIASL
ncbi:MAG: AAA family ATPase [Candidatus Nanopelagicales bacterium]